MKNVILYFGSFNPIHKGHIALAEYVVEQALCDEVVLIVSPQNPLKPIEVQAPELDRFEMAELACAASKYPDRIKPSIVEFLLDKPSYTIDTLHYLVANYGAERHFSILMGGDLIPQLDQWKAYTEILDNYHLYVYPRREERVDRYLDRITYLKDAPLYDYSSTAIREALERGDDVSDCMPESVLHYIREKELWSPAKKLVALTAEIGQTPDNADLYVERGKWFYRRNEWGKALNDFNCAVKIAPDHAEAQQFVNIVQEILAFRYKDIYNP
ncbi:MAG: nicotinate (nicotinamide) nucleotide adenylyltransferase [Alistipes sp.]